MFLIDPAKLKAALTHAASRDIRYYLNGILIEITSEDHAAIVATDGHRAFVGRIAGPTGLAPTQIIVPTDVVKVAIKSKSPVVLQCIDGKWQLGAMNFEPIDGNFPDWRRIVPRSMPDRDKPYAIYNWDYVADAQAAIRLWTGRKTAQVRLRLFDGSSFASSDDDTAFSVIMPMRDRPGDAYADPFDLPR